MEITLASIIALACAIFYVILARAALVRVSDSRMKWWVTATMIVAALTGATFLLSPDETLIQNLTGGGVHVLGMSLNMVFISSLTVVYLQRQRVRPWFAVGLLWWIVLSALTVVTSEGELGSENWFGNAISDVYIPGILALAGWIVVAGFPLLLTFYTFYRATLAEVANRTIFWAITLPLALMGAVLATTASTGLIELGLLLQFTGLLGMIYAAINLRVIDVRRNVWLAIAAGLTTALTALAIFVPLLIANNSNLDGSQQVAFFGALSIMVALLYMVLRYSINAVVMRFSGQQQSDVAGSLHDFAEAISGVVELDELVKVILDNMRSILRVQRGGLIFTEETRPLGAQTSFYKLRVRSVEDNDIPTANGTLTIDSPILKRLFLERYTLLQFDIDYNPQFAGATAEERKFFKTLHMAAYAPIIAQGKVIGILCAGTKVNDEAFLPSDLELLSTLANQAGVALRNARLVDDLRRREQEASDTNIALSNTKEQLEQLDAVKTDFITIASHELRTPLAQIRGYTDIIEALNDQGMLDPEQLSGMTTNLRKATDRMEELIRNMLDVSQLDVNAMDLRFNKITVENVVRMAIEPLTESIRNRKQSLTARGLRGLPEIEADMQRLVQAFQNVVLNAVKFTPDGGRIDITGSLKNNPETGRDEIVVAIADSGIGIDKKNHEIIFEKFVRAHDPSLHSTGKTKFMGAGPGLGLTIARGVIDGHGGHIWVESKGFDAENLNGSTFYIVLPVKPPEDATGVLHFEPTLTNQDRSKLLEATKT